MDNDEFSYEMEKRSFKKAIFLMLTDIIIYDRYFDVLKKETNITIPLSQIEYTHHLKNYLHVYIPSELWRNDIERIVGRHGCLHNFFDVFYEMYCQIHGEFTNTDIYDFFNQNEEYIKNHIETLKSCDDAEKIKQRFLHNISFCSRCFSLNCVNHFEEEELFSSNKGFKLWTKLIYYKPFKVGSG